MKTAALLALLFTFGLFASVLAQLVATAAYRSYAAVRSWVSKLFAGSRMEIELALAEYAVRTGSLRRFAQVAGAATLLLLAPFSSGAAATITARLWGDDAKYAFSAARREWGERREKPQDESLSGDLYTFSGEPPDLWTHLDLLAREQEVAAMALSYSPLVASAISSRATRRTFRFLSALEPEFSSEVNDWVLRHQYLAGSIKRGDLVTVISRCAETSAKVQENEPSSPSHDVEIGYRALGWLYSFDNSPKAPTLQEYFVEESAADQKREGASEAARGEGAEEERG